MKRKAMLLLLVVFFSAPMALGYGEEGRREHEGGGGGRRGEWPEEEEHGERGRGEWPEEEPERGRVEKGELFLLKHSKQVVKTEAGEMRAVVGYGGKSIQHPMHIGFINMEPESLFIPQYIDSNLIVFVRNGEAKIGLIHKDELVEKNLKKGDIYSIQAGSTFYLVNTGQGQILQLICCIDTSESLGLGIFQSFYIGGGTYSLLTGFDQQTLRTAFNVSSSELDELLRKPYGPIVFLKSGDQPKKSLMHSKQLKSRTENNDAVKKEKKEENSSTWRNLLKSVFGGDDLKQEQQQQEEENKSSSPDPYNIYDSKPGFKNDYGWSLAIDHDDYSPLKSSGIGVYLVSLTAGAMMAPHVNPTAAEFGIVLGGSGRIEVIYPNGSSAMNEVVEEGDVFWVPRYFPFCQIASKYGPFEFFGFTTCSRENNPQFLVGASSILTTMKGPEIATSFDLTLETFSEIIEYQHESVILPSAEAAPPKKQEEEEEQEEKKMNEAVPKFMRSFGTDMEFV